MGNRFASGKIAIAICDRCGFQFRLRNLKEEIIKTKRYNILVCQECWDPDQPQLQLGMYPVDDPQALRNPRRDTTYVTAGVNATGSLTKLFVTPPHLCAPFSATIGNRYSVIRLSVYVL